MTIKSERNVKVKRKWQINELFGRTNQLSEHSHIEYRFWYIGKRISIVRQDRGRSRKMKDKEIRKILIAYLQAQKAEMRIYQEKSIGSSICDLMVVTDRLTGYEIKSDSDDYKRLPEQVRTYTRFFDRNYIVVGRSHAESARSKVPDDWGIICVERDNVTVEREAKENKAVSRRSQLSVLWKLELKNILLKNGMPLYAQKEKGYISDRIADKPLLP